MARPLRIEYPGALYHVTARGNKRLPIFQDDIDRRHFLSLLAKTCSVYNWRCHAYCLMDNHYHLLIETLEGNLSQGMRDLNGIYTQDCNRRHESVGHLLQGRYKALIIEKETYLLEVARYIVLNPVRAKIVSHPEQWKWSNYRVTSGRIPTPDFLCVDWTLELFSRKRLAAQKAYKQFIADGIGKISPFENIAHACILGSPQFVAETWERIQDADMVPEFSVTERHIGRPSLSDLFHTHDTNAERDKAIALARYRCAYTITAIARHLRLHRTTISRILTKCDK